MSLIAILILAATTTATPPDASIVVTGTRTPPKLAPSIRQVSVQPVDDQIARWRTPVCVGVVGVPNDIAARVIVRIEAAARDAEILLARRPCRANSLVTFASDGAAVARALHKKRGGIFGALPTRERELLLRSDLPVRWWYRYGASGGGGQPVTDGAAAIGANASPTDGIGLPARITSSYHATLIGTKFNVDVVAAMVIADVTGTTGTALDAVSDYAGRVILGPTRFPAKPPEQPTILTLFTGPLDTTGGLTRFDRAYLWALHRLPPERAAWSQRGRFAALVSQRMAEK